VKDPISGTWTTGANFMRLKYDGRGAVTGIITAGHAGNPAAIKTGTFDPSTAEMVLAGDARNPRDGSTVTYEIRGRLTEGCLVVDWRFGPDTGSGTLVKLTAARVLRSVFTGLRHMAESFVQAIAVPAVRAMHPRPTKEQNEKLMLERGENPATFEIREARKEEIDELAQLHVVTWAATYPEVLRPPTFAIRSWQWREAFEKRDGKWFCYVVVNAQGKLVGFAKGVRESDGRGDLNKIYLLWDYHRMGLGRRMLGKVTRRFMSMGVTTMIVRAEANNPSCRFYEATGGVNVLDDKGKPELGNYVWRDLAALSAQCPD
jgi:ribosomal protein S18 acetylase RimI-like enzyme